jgi:hypothetical protein
MYNTNIICTYNTPEVFLKTDVLTEKDRQFIRDTIYRQELLNIFEIEEYTDKKLDKAINKLYAKIKEHAELKECMLKLAQHCMSVDEKLGLMMLFSYDCMHVAHICISELLETGSITETSMTNLKAIVFLQ